MDSPFRRVVKSRPLSGGFVYHGITTNVGNGSFSTRRVEPLHRFLQAPLGRVQVSRGLRKVRVPEHFLDMMDRPAGFEPAAACLVPEIMKMQIDRAGTPRGIPH